MSVEQITKYRTNLKQWRDEIECYTRLAYSNRVPTLVDYNEKDLSITLSNEGLSLFILTEIKKEKIKINLLEQLYEFISACEQQSIVHLDFHPGNILLKNKNLTVVDFELVSIDDKVSTNKCVKRYQKWKQRGGWKHVINTYIKYFKNFDNKLWYRDDIMQQELKKYGKAF